MRRACLSIIISNHLLLLVLLLNNGATCIHYAFQFQTYCVVLVFLTKYEARTKQIHSELITRPSEPAIQEIKMIKFCLKLSQYSTVVLTVVRVMIAKYRKSGIWGYRSSLTPEPDELK